VRKRSQMWHAYVCSILNTINDAGSGLPSTIPPAKQT
jgi:hypothetical protein